MMKPQIHFLSCCAIGFLMAYCFATTSHAQAVAEVSQAVVIRNSGKVEIVAKDGTVRDAFLTPPAAAGAALASREQKGVTVTAPDATPSMNAYLLPGETLRTGKDGSVDIVLAGGGSARLDADSTLKLPEKKEETPPSESLEILKGRLFFNIDGAALSRDKQEFRLKTPPAILAVKGTRFFVQSDGADETVGVHQGMVSIQGAAPNQKQSVGQGNAIVATNAGFSQPKALSSEQVKLGSIYPEIEFQRHPSTGLMLWTPLAASALPTLGGKKTNLAVEIGSVNGGGAYVVSYKNHNKTLDDRGGVVGAIYKPISGRNMLFQSTTCLFEFSVVAAGARAIKVIPCVGTKVVGAYGKLIANENKVGTLSLSSGEQPFWEVLEGVRTTTFAPSGTGMVVPVNANTPTRVVVPFPNAQQSRDCFLFVITYPHEPKYTQADAPIELTIRDEAFLTRKK